MEESSTSDLNETQDRTVTVELKSECPESEQSKNLTSHTEPGALEDAAECNQNMEMDSSDFVLEEGIGIRNAEQQSLYYAPTPSSGSNSETEEDVNEDNVSQMNESSYSNFQNNQDFQGEWTYDMDEIKSGGQTTMESIKDQMKTEPNHDEHGGSSFNQDSFDMSSENGNGNGDSQDGSVMTENNYDGGISQNEESTNMSGSDDQTNKTFKIFVSNLPPGIQKSDLLDLFQKFGEVAECENFAKNYAFVHMTSDECGQRAVEELNGYEIQGCKINVKRSYHKGRGLLLANVIPEVNLQTGTFKLYVNNLKQDFTKENVSKLFEEYGRIVEVELYRGTSAFVHMETEEEGRAAIKALNGKLLPDCEKPLLVSVSKNPEGPSLPTTKLKVTNVPISLSAEELRKFFIPYGLVLRVRIFQHNDPTSIGRIAIVHLEQFGNIRSAIKELNGKMIEDQQINVEAFFGDEKEFAPPPLLPPVQKPKQFRRPRNDEEPFLIPRRRGLGMPISSGMRLVPMPSQKELWGPPVPQPSGMRLIPMPSQEELQRCPRAGPGKSRLLLPPPPPRPLMAERPFFGQPEPVGNYYNNDFSRDEGFDDGFGGGYSNYDNDAYGYEDNSFGPPPRKVPKNKWNKFPKQNQNQGSGGSSVKNNRRGGHSFPEIPPTQSFPKPPQSLLSMQISNPIPDFDYSSDLPISSFTNFAANPQQDVCRNEPFSNSLNAVPFDYSQMNNKKNRNNNNFRNNTSSMQFRGGGRGNKQNVGMGKGKKAKGKPRRPGLGTSAQQRKFANQSGLNVTEEASASNSSARQTEYAEGTSNPSNTSEATAGGSSSTSPYSAYYFQQSWNLKSKKPNRKPSVKEVKNAEEEQKRLYAEYLKQKPWLYQPIPGIVKKVEK